MYVTTYLVAVQDLNAFDVTHHGLDWGNSLTEVHTWKKKCLANETKKSLLCSSFVSQIKAIVCMYESAIDLEDLIMD